jgi:hypothetical protein
MVAANRSSLATSVANKTKTTVNTLEKNRTVLTKIIIQNPTITTISNTTKNKVMILVFIFSS